MTVLRTGMHLSWFRDDHSEESVYDIQLQRTTNGETARNGIGRSAERSSCHGVQQKTAFHKDNNASK